jgi:hypothetical protein
MTPSGSSDLKRLRSESLGTRDRVDVGYSYPGEVTPRPNERLWALGNWRCDGLRAIYISPQQEK